MRSKPSPNQPTPELRDAIWRRDSKSCCRCGQFVWLSEAEIHHRLLRSQHPDNSPANLVTLCGPCHAEAHSRRRLIGEPEGWIVPSWADPASTPVWCEGRWQQPGPVWHAGSMQPWQVSP